MVETPKTIRHREATTREAADGNDEATSTRSTTCCLTPEALERRNEDLERRSAWIGDATTTMLLLLTTATLYCVS